MIRSSLGRAALLAFAVGAGALADEADVAPDALLLDGHATATVTIKTTEPAGLQARASVGQLVDRKELPGEVRFTFVPPARGSPQVALLVFWRESREGPPSISTARVELSGRTDLQVHTEPGAQVQVQVGERLFGPRTTDAAGNASVPIEVPPGVHSAKVLGSRKSKSSTLTVPIDVPLSNPLVGFISPSRIPAGRSGWLWLGSPLPAAPSPTLHAEGAALRPIQLDASTALYEVTPLEGSRRVTIGARASGRTKAKLELAAEVFSAPAPPPPTPVPAPVPPPTRPAPTQPFMPAVAVGGFFGGGANIGPAIDVALGYRLARFANRIALEGSLGLRQASFQTEVAGLGALSSSLLGISIQAGIRARLYEGYVWSFDTRLSAGLLPVSHQTQSTFQSAFSESALAPDVFVGIQGGYRVGTFELFVEAGVSFAAVHTNQIDANLGGGRLALGGRFAR